MAIFPQLMKYQYDKVVNGSFSVSNCGKPYFCYFINETQANVVHKTIFKCDENSEFLMEKIVRMTYKEESELCSNSLDNCRSIF